MEIVTGVAAEIAKHTVAPLKQWLCYSFHYRSNMRSMKNQAERLQHARDSVQHSVDAAIRNGEEIESDVNKWLEDVDKIMELAGKVPEGEEEAKINCSDRACLNLKLRHQLSQKAKKIEQVIREALEKGRFDKVSYRPALQGIVTSRNRNYVDLESRMSTVKELMEALRDPNINLIGVWGTAGVGKTTMVREVARQAKEEKVFNEVAMTHVTQSPDLRRIQGEIADMLDLKFDEETILGRASRLRKRLSQDSKILLLLDDIWGKLDLDAIGIPSEGCKLVLTSRNRDVLFSEIGIQKDFGLQVLSKDEAWYLFENMAGDCVKDPTLRCTSIEVAKECGGLPIAIVTVAKALKNKTLSEWKDALLQLRRPAPGHLTRMQSTIYSSIELSYSHLESQEVQYLFCRCADMHFSINYLDLLKYCYGLGSFYGITTLDEARNRLYRIIRNLKDSCLLLDCPHSSENCHMHDVIRDVAKLIASRDHNIIVARDGYGDVLRSCKELSICGRDIHELPNEMECPELRFLHMHGRDHTWHIPDTFFHGMGNLKVLDLTTLQLSSLPCSLLLRNLQTLCLDDCLWEDVAIIGELKSLKILSLIGSQISQLPREIGLLTHLHLLDLSHCSKLKVIPPNVLSNLVELEELYMKDSCIQWEDEGLKSQRINANLGELRPLLNLTTLEVQIQDACSLPKDLLFEKLERYIILLGDIWDGSDCKTSRTLKLKVKEGFRLGVGIKMLLKRTENLYLDEFSGINSILHELLRDGFQQLQHLHIQNNPEIKYIINSRMLVSAFPVLETFLLKNMTGLEEICCGQLPSTSFRSLRVVKVDHCDKLKFVFLSSIAGGLSQLEELEIKECSILGAIVVKEGEIEDRDLILFPKLRRLSLWLLPKLKRFLSTKSSFMNDAGEIIPEDKIDFYMPILRENVVLPNLENLELRSIGLEDVQHNQRRATRSSCILESMQSMSRFHNLSHLEVQGSANIEYLLSFSAAGFMVQLKHLHILECKVMKEVLVAEQLGVEEETTPKELFPQLECLLLKDLPLLERFCSGSRIRFPLLKSLRIEHCPKFKTFIPISSAMMAKKEHKAVNAQENPQTAMQSLFNEEVAFPSLERLGISHIDDLKIIWQNQFGLDSFCKLRWVAVEFCENLTNIFQHHILARFQTLEDLIVTHCASLQEVFELKGLNVKNKDAVTDMQLKRLALVHLPAMKHVWNKDPQEIFSFQNLQNIYAEECENLKSFFPASVARCLMQLKILRITNCGLEEIVGGEKEAEAIERFVFPQVTVLHLVGLHRLKWFYPWRHASEWPMLKDMLVRGCQEVDIFASEPLRETLQGSQPLFFVNEYTFPNLVMLRLAHIRSSIWRGQVVGECFSKLRAIRFICGSSQSCPFSFLTRLHNLEFLNVIHTRWEEIFPYEEVLRQENDARILPKLRDLRLDELPMLTHLWKEDTQPCPVFRDLEVLKVSVCGKLKCLAPSSVSFENLSELGISKCHGLIKLVTSPVAKSLVQLKKMRVSECELITEIVTGDGGETEEVITFSKLTYLKLKCLPKLTSFCSGSYYFEFPSLEELIVKQCPEMKVFSCGIVSVPKLERIKEAKEEEGHWKDDLNTTIQWLWKGKLLPPC